VNARQAPKTIVEDAEAHAKLTTMLSKTKGAGSIYPANVSGTYRGFWKAQPKPTNSTASNAPPNKLQGAGVKGVQAEDARCSSSLSLFF
jgi:hypothetical protein